MYKNIIQFIVFSIFYTFFSTCAIASGINNIISDQATNMARDFKEPDSFQNIRFSKPESTPVSPIKPLTGDPSVQFHLKYIQLTRTLAIAQEDLEYLWADHKNTTVSIVDIQHIAQKIAAHYRKAGYILAQAVIPQQDITPANGVVRIQVLEGFLNAIHIEGGTPEDQHLVENQLQDIPYGVPFNMNDIETRLLNIKKTPGFTIRTVLKPAEYKTGFTDIVFVIERKKYIEASLMGDNLGNKYISRRRFGGDMIINNLIGRSKLLLAHIQSSDPKRFSLYRARQTQFLGDAGTRLYVEYMQSRTRANFIIPNKSLFDYWNVMLMHPLLYKRDETFKIRFAIDGQDDLTYYLGSRFKEDYVRSARIGALYNKSYEHDFLEFSALFNKGLASGLGAKASSHPSRFGGRHNYHYVDGRALWAHQFNQQFSLLGTFGWQVSRSPLLAGEEFNIGAVNFGRGYDATEISGDNGLAGLLEARYTVYSPLQFIEHLQFYASYGGAQVRNLKEKKDSKRFNSIASAALGVRGRILKNVEVTVEAAKPLTKKPTLRNSSKVVVTSRMALKYKWDEEFGLQGSKSEKTEKAEEK